MSWETTGNAGTNPATDFVGTTDPRPLVVRTKNLEAFRVDTAGNVGMGTATPATKLEVVGNWTEQEGALRVTGDKPTLKFAGGSIAGNASWILHLGSRGPGNLLFAKQGATPTTWDTVMTLSHLANSGTPAVEINGDWNGTEGALKLTGDKPTLKFAGGGAAGNVSWLFHLGSHGPGNLEFMKVEGPPGAFTSLLTLSPALKVGIGTSNPSSKLDVVGTILGRGTDDAGVNGLHGDPQLQEIPTIESNHAGVFGASAEGAGVMGYSRNKASFGVIAFGGIQASAVNHPLAGAFEGNVRVDGSVQVTGDISFPGADFAEQFNVVGSEVIEPGCVVVIDQEDALRKSQQAYDTKVAGVVSGAGEYRPGIVLDKQNGQGDRLQVALGGKVYCRVDAGYGAIEIGDLLTSSPTPGYAMKASDPKRAFGAVIGKALRPLATGKELIPILIALQ